MPIVFNCPGCGKRYSVEEKFAGKKVKCKECARAIAVPTAQAPLRSARANTGPSYDDLLDEPRAPVKRFIQTESAETEDDLPPPRRMAFRPATAKSNVKHTSGTRLPLLVKIGLMLIGALLAVGGTGMLFVAISTGHPEAIWEALTLWGTCVFGGIAVVCNLKLLFMGQACGYGGLPWYTPFRGLVWIVTNLSETGPLLLGNLAGIAVLAIIWTVEIRHVKGMQAARQVAAVPTPPVQVLSEKAIVKSVPANDASGIAPAVKPDPLKSALSALKSSEAQKRNEAVAELGRMSPVDDQRDAVREALQPLLDDEDGFRVIDVARAMAKWLTPETVPALIPKVTDSRFGVRWEVIKILGELGDARAVKAIAGRLKEDGIAAEPALRQLGSAAEPVLIEVLKDPDPVLRIKACRLLKVVGGAETLAFMKSAKADPDEGVRREAKQTMMTISARIAARAKK